MSLPENECGDEKQGDDNENRNVWSIPADDIAFRQGEHQTKKAYGDEEGARIVNVS